MLRRAILIAFIIPLMMSIIKAEASSTSEEVSACLECHSKKGIIKKFENGETIDAFVDVGKLKSSVHSSFTCSECHTGFSVQDHPSGKFRSKKEYRLKSALICRKCHPEKQLMSKEIHANLIAREREGRAPVCTDCHGSHAVSPISGGRVFANEREYCMSCHAHGIEMLFKSGERVVLRIDPGVLKESVHSRLSCSDCHFGFSRSQHPKRNFRNEREFRIANSEVCRRCHFDKYTKALESIHYTMLSQGNLNAPVCIDCHGSHSIGRAGLEKVWSSKRCRRCHENIYNVYAKSIHGNALINESNQDVPVCTDCHRAHDIEDPRTFDYKEKVPEICGNCHSNKQIMSKYGLSTDVINNYLQDFHGITLSFYRKEKNMAVRSDKGIAVCTDCHGIHDITKTSGPSSNVLKKNLVKSCMKCHPDATENFPDAWLSHYEPTLKKAPLVFLVKLFYRIFIPFMMIGLILQILLHIWRYAVNR